MRLLVLTQTVDADDPVLGFFQDWLIEFSKNFDSIEVICLKEGRHCLPQNVQVYSLGKEKNASRFTYVIRFYRYIWSLRRRHDAVFVHMNQEYVLLGAIPWRLWSKRVVLWRNHKKGSLLTRIACTFVHAVCYTSPESFVAYRKNAVQMPIGIDTTKFSLPAVLAPENSILFFGRLDAVKRPDLFVEALKLLHSQGITFRATICGSPTNPKDPLATALMRRAGDLIGSGKLIFHDAVKHDAAHSVYNSHAIYVNLTPSGSFDKTIGEAMASGCAVVASNGVVKDLLSDLFVYDVSVSTLAQCLNTALNMDVVERQSYANKCRSYIEGEHSLTLLSVRLLGILAQ